MTGALHVAVVLSARETKYSDRGYVPPTEEPQPLTGLR